MHKTGLITLIQAGPHTLLQDFGRQGTQHLGFCQSGAIDEHSFLWANKLVSNDMNSPCLEISFGPFECIFSDIATIAITGAANKIQILNNGEARQINGWQSIHIHPGDKLHISAPKTGLRTYLAIEGGFVHDSVFNSAAMVPKEHSGPYGGDCFSKAHQLNYCLANDNAHKNRRKKITPSAYIPNYEQDLTLTFIPHPDIQSQNPELIQQFILNEYSIGSHSNRMAYSLESETPITIENKNRLSAATPYGTIQIPPSGKPFILLKDRQTIGGYPVLGYVTHLDCFKLGQGRPHQKVRFSQTTLEASQEKLVEFYTFFSI
ncbi:MAG: biotin-dependent carboxyltransferase family protein [Agarilytica sp.]